MADVNIRWSERSDGDFHIEQPLFDLERTRRRFVDLPWSQPDEVHGIDIAEVVRPGQFDREVYDGLITDLADVVLGIWVGDCAPVALISDSGRIGAFHAGWRGIEAGVLQRGVAAVRRSTDVVVSAVLGPCIHPCCYAFGADDLERLVGRLGPTVVGRTRDGKPALDVPAAVRAALGEVGVVLDDRSTCTGCNPDRFYSHRARGERQRQVMALWRTDGAVMAGS